MLYTNKQIYAEASIIFYSATTLDLRMPALLNIWRPFSQLVNIFKHGLQYVQHLKMNNRFSFSFLFCNGQDSLWVLASLGRI